MANKVLKGHPVFEMRKKHLALRGNEWKTASYTNRKLHQALRILMDLDDDGAHTTPDAQNYRLMRLVGQRLHSRSTHVKHTKTPQGNGPQFDHERANTIDAGLAPFEQADTGQRSKISMRGWAL